MKNKVLIEYDPCFIRQRLTEIDDSYFLVYDIRRHAYEVHSSDQGSYTFCFTVPFDCLDERTLTHALRTRSQNQETLIRELDAYNEKLHKENMKKAVEKAAEGVL